MSIRGKLLLLVLIFVAAFLVTLGIEIVYYAQFRVLSAEEQVFEDLDDALGDLKSEVLFLGQNLLVQQWDRVDTVKVRTDGLFSAVAELEALPEANDTLAETVVIINNLDLIFDTDWSKLQRTYALVRDYAEEMFNDVRTITFLSFYTNAYLVEAREDSQQIYYALSEYTEALVALEHTLGVANRVLEEQFDVVTAEIARLEQMGLIFRMAAAVVVYGIGFLIAWLIAGRIARNIVILERRIETLKGGDLTVGFGISSKDDLGRLANDMGEFTTTLRGSVVGIKDLASDNLETNERLVVSVEETTAATRQIRANIASINGQIETLDDKIGMSNQVVESADGLVQDLKKEIQEQTSMVEESTAAVTQMITSIGNVADITQKKLEATETLAIVAGEGDRKLSQTTGVIQEINDAVGDIRETASIIQGVAARTSLLSMNAAIEAAHAGEYGAGFSVVADEIRKLADTSSENSKRIAGVVKEVVKKIEAASSAGDATRRVYDGIKDEIVEVSHSLQEIGTGMRELNEGSRQILEAMNHLRTLSTDVSDAGGKMTGASSDLYKLIMELRQVSREVVGGIAEIGAGIKEINVSMDSVSEVSERINGVSENLNETVKRFRTEA